jgi:hypothetical protein
MKFTLFAFNAIMFPGKTCIVLWLLFSVLNRSVFVRPKPPKIRLPVDVMAAHPNAPHDRDPDTVPLPVTEIFVVERPNSSTDAMIELASGMGRSPLIAKAIPLI